MAGHVGAPLRQGATALQAAPAASGGTVQGRRLECPLKDVGDRLGPDELEPIAHRLGNVIEVAPIARGEDHRVQAGARRRDAFLLDPADGHHDSAQADLAGHRDVGSNGPFGQERSQ